jgi:crossover junction endodeoxyribonuclease RuvC
MPIYLGIDPGIADMGFGVISVDGREERCIAYGSLRTPAGMPLEQRLQKLYDGLEDLIKKYRPVAAGLENIYFQKNVKTAITVAEARGVICLCLAKNAVSFVEFNPADVKVAVCGYGLADKTQVQRMVQSLLKLKEIPKPDDAADALAIAIAAAHSIPPKDRKKR